MFGNPEPPRAGARALKFYAFHARGYMPRIPGHQGGYSSRHRAQDSRKWLITKWRAPVPRSRIRHRLGEGISREGDLIDLCVDNVSSKERHGIIFGRRTHGPGRETPRVFLKENTDVLESWETVLRKKLKSSMLPGNSNAQLSGDLHATSFPCASRKAPMRPRRQLRARTPSTPGSRLGSCSCVPAELHDRGEAVQNATSTLLVPPF